MPDPVPTQPQAAASSGPVLALIRDLMFVSRVTSEARALGVDARIVREPGKLAGQPGRTLIVDLNLEGAIDAAAAWRAAAGAPVVGFVSHVDTATIARARAAGIDRVMARSQFVQILPDLLRADPGEDASTR